MRPCAPRPDDLRFTGRLNPAWTMRERNRLIAIASGGAVTTVTRASRASWVNADGSTDVPVAKKVVSASSLKAGSDW